MEAAILSSCATIGVENLKEKQKEAITSFVQGDNVLYSQLDMESPCASSYYNWCLIACKEKKRHQL